MSHNAPRTLYLIDGHAQMFRSFFAIRTPMTSPVTGEPTGASFAFTGMLLKLFLDYKPDFVAMAIDTKEPTYRNALYPEYKAHREAPPEEFVAQIPRMIEIAEAFGVPVLGVPGAEADDIIATLATRLSREQPDLCVAMVSKDKDLQQLLSDRVSLVDVHTGDKLDVAGLLEAKGVRPDQIVDLQTLCGDSVDNIPGAKGVGPKTAAALLAEFDSLDNLMANLDQVKGKRKENLEAFREQLPITRQLVTLRQDVELDFDLARCTPDHIDAARLHVIFRDLGFHRHVRDLERLTSTKAADDGLASSADPPAPGSSTKPAVDDMPFGLFAEVSSEPEPAAPPLPVNDNYRAITTQAQLDELVQTLQQQAVIAIDTETHGLSHRAELCGICLAWRENQGVYIPVQCPPPEVPPEDEDSQIPLPSEKILDALRPIFTDASKLKVAHNLKYDYLVLQHAGLTMHGPFFDTMIAAFLLNEPGLKLDDLALAQFQHPMIPIERLIGPRPSGRNKTPQKSMRDIPLDVITQYAAEDADFTLRLYNRFAPQLKIHGMSQLADDVEMPLTQVLAEMEAAGVRVDPDVLDQQRDQLQTRIDELRDEIHAAAGTPFNVDSPKQLAEVLFTQLGLPVLKKTRTGPSTDAEVLDKLCALEDVDPQKLRVPQLVAEHRQLAKLVGTYLVALKNAIDPQTRRVHARFHQTGAATGRLSSSDPNLQNIPIRTDVGRDIRKAFVAEPGSMLISADYSQIELRMLAHLSDDKALIDAFKNDMDIHTAVAAEVFGVDPQAVTKEQRASAKVVNFGIIYGVTAYGLARRIEGLDNAGAKQLITDYRKRFSGIDRFLEACVEHAKSHGYVSTIMGRRRSIAQLDARNPQLRALGERLAINTVVQGSAADLIKLAMVQLHQRIERDRLPVKLLIQIHDELVIEAPADFEAEATRVLVDTMESAMKLKVPLKADPGAGVNWFEAK